MRYWARLCFLSGPSFAKEVAQKLPTAVAIAASDITVARKAQEVFSNSSFRVYTNPDVIGLELAGSLKNVVAIAAGVLEGMGYGSNTMAALLTRGLAEMARLGEAFGARPETFAGLAGMGDLIVTCESRHGRNRRAGELIAQGMSPERAVAEIGQTVEGITTAPVLQELAQRVGVELPITDGVCAVLSGQSLTELMFRLMGRQPTEE